MPFDIYFQKLFKLSAKTPISVFQQSAHTGNTPASVNDPRTGRVWQLPEDLHMNVVGGMCAGACLDWMRKVLQSDKKAVDHLKESRVLRMAQTHVNKNSKAMLDTKLTGPLRDQAAALGKLAGAVEVPATADIRAAFVQWVTDNGGSWPEGGQPKFSGSAQLVNIFNLKMAELNAAVLSRNAAQAQKNKLITDKNALTDAANLIVDDWNLKSGAERQAMVWEHLATGMGTDAEKDRKFTDICPVASGPKVAYASFNDFLISALSSEHFSAGRGLVIGLSFIPEPGHDIAVQFVSADRLLLFDPNLGVYQFRSLQMLVIALVVLVEIGYLGTDSDGETTALGSEHDWQVFARTNALLPGGGAGPLATEEDVRRACADAQDVLEQAGIAAAGILETALHDAQQAHVALQQQDSNQARVNWVNAHNQAVMAFNAARDASLLTSRQICPAFNSEFIEYQAI